MILVSFLNMRFIFSSSTWKEHERYKVSLTEAVESKNKILTFHNLLCLTLRVFSFKIWLSNSIFPKECYMWLMKLLFNKCLLSLSLFSQVIVYFLITKRWACDLLQPYERNTRVRYLQCTHAVWFNYVLLGSSVRENSLHYQLDIQPGSRLMMQTQRNRFGYKWDSGIRLSWTTDWCSQLTDFNKSHRATADS